MIGIIFFYDHNLSPDGMVPVILTHNNTTMLRLPAPEGQSESYPEWMRERQFLKN